MKTAAGLGKALAQQGGQLGEIGNKILELPPAEAEILSALLADTGEHAEHASHEAEDEEGYYLG